MKPTGKICTLAEGRPDRRCIGRAADIIHRGGVVVFPTRSLYGLGASALNAEAVAAVFRIKGRDRAKPLLALVADMDVLQQVALPPDPAVRHMMNTFWPGRVTFVIPAREGIDDGLTAGSGKIGVRIPGHPVAAALVRAVGHPVPSTSANLSGAGGCAAVDELAPSMVDGVDFILDAGTLSGGAGSTVVDVSGKAPVILRQGAVPAEQIMACLRQYQGKNIDIGG